MANMTFKANLIPNDDEVQELGSSTKKWKIYGVLHGNADTATSATTATTATKLANTSEIGSTTVPVYFDDDGLPYACTSLSLDTTGNAATATNLASPPILASGGTNPTILAANSTYTLTVGEQNIVFKTPNDNNTITSISSISDTGFVSGITANNGVLAITTTKTLGSNTVTGKSSVITLESDSGKIQLYSFGSHQDSTNQKGIWLPAHGNDTKGTNVFVATANNNVTFYGSLNGNADTATKLANTNAIGSTAVPVYFSSGQPIACSHSLNADVPSDAVFTDTHYITKLISGNGSSTSNTAVTSGNIYLRLFDGTTHRNSIQLKSGNNMSITSNDSGVITFSATDTVTSISSTSGTGFVSGITASDGALTITKSKKIGTSSTTNDSSVITLESDSGQIQLYSYGSTATAANRKGIWLPAHGSDGTGKSVFSADANNNIYFNGTLYGMVTGSQSATDSNYVKICEWHKNIGTNTSYPDYTGSLVPQIGHHNQGNTYGALILLPYSYTPTANQNEIWRGKNGLYIGQTVLKWENKNILHSGNLGYTINTTNINNQNYAVQLDSNNKMYVNVSNCVTTNTDQNIDGIKTFTKSILINNSCKIYSPDADAESTIGRDCSFSMVLGGGNTIGSNNNNDKSINTLTIGNSNSLTKGRKAFILGDNNNCDNMISGIIVGSYNSIQGPSTGSPISHSFLFGDNLQTLHSDYFAIGQYNSATTDTQIFAIGNGTSEQNRSNALDIDTNGLIRYYEYKNNNNKGTGGLRGITTRKQAGQGGWNYCPVTFASKSGNSETTFAQLGCYGANADAKYIHLGFGNTYDACLNTGLRILPDGSLAVSYNSYGQSDPNSPVDGQIYLWINSDQSASNSNWYECSLMVYCANANITNGWSIEE